MPISPRMSRNFAYGPDRTSLPAAQPAYAYSAYAPQAYAPRSYPSSYGMPVQSLWSPMPATQSVVSQGGSSLQNIEAEQYKNTGNEFRKLKLYSQAMWSYDAAIRANPYYTDAYFNQAQLMLLMGNVPKAIALMTQLLTITPNDHDSRVILGEFYEKTGNTQEAKKRYMEVLRVKPDFDPARRHLEYILYQDQKRFYPDTADELMKTRYRELVYKAQELLQQYFTIHHPNPVLKKMAQALPIVFEETQQVDETPNIAEYDAFKGVIRLHPMMLFSTPNVVSAYLVHELIHALGGTPETSVLEEQDGYRELARFWSIYQGAENDPNLDRAFALYQKSPDALDQEVRRVYTIRNANMPEKSAGHGLPPQTVQAKAYAQYETQNARENLDKLKSLMALKSISLR